MAFTDRAFEVADQASAAARRARQSPVYLVPDWVRVRAEDFGLLFYDTRSTRLTFVRSGDRLVPPPFTGARASARGARRRRAAKPAALAAPARRSGGALAPA